MARPIKKGLDYFPLNVDVDQDDKFQLVEAVHGITGFGITIQLLMRIYKEGFYYKWTEIEQLLFSRRVNVDINVVVEVVNDCIKYGVFDSSMYESHGILTSKGIQERYFEATIRRKAVVVDGEFLLINTKLYPNVSFKRVNVDINDESHVLNDCKSTQSKVKESRVKESEVEKSEIEENEGENKTMKKPEEAKVNTDELFEELFKEWWDLYAHKVGDKKRCKTKYKTLLKKNKHEHIMQGTKRYKQHLIDLKAKGEFAPNMKNPLTFLNGENFDDEYETTASVVVTANNNMYKSLGGREY